MPFPNFHGAGLSFKMGFSVFFDSPMVSPPGAPLTADLAADCLEYAGVQAAFFPPSILREMIRDPKLAKSFEHVEYVASGMCFPAHVTGAYLSDRRRRSIRGRRGTGA